MCGLLLAGGLAGSAQAAVSYSQQTLNFSGLTLPVGVAVDSGGDVFTADDALLDEFDPPGSVDTLDELSAGGSESTLDSTVTAAFSLMATDADGDVFVVDLDGNSVLEFKRGVTGYALSATIPVAGADPASEEILGVAVDASGDLFVSDVNGGGDGNGYVYELQLQSNGSYEQLPSPVLSGLSGPVGVAVDQTGDLFVVETDVEQVLKLPATDLTSVPPGGYTPASSAVTAIAGGLTGPFGVAVDQAGNVYVADDNGAVVELSPQGASYTGSVLPFIGLEQPDGVAVDQHGDVFATTSNSSANTGAVVELAVDQSQSITWSAAASYTYPGSGSLTETLDATAGSGLPVSYTVASGSVCSVSGSTLTITGTGTCELAADQAGGFNGTEAFSAASEVDQTVTISPAQRPQSISWTQSLGPYVVGAGPVTLTGTATPSGLPVSYTATGPCSVSGSTLTLTGAGVCTVSASQTGDSAYLPASPVQRSIVTEYGFEGFITPLWNDTFQPGATIPVWFVLTNAAGKPIPAATAAALAKAGDVNAVLTGPGITAQTAACGWYSIVFECSVTTPKTVKTGTGNPYTITAQENVGAGFLTAPPIAPAKNPDTIYFK
jgi:sugar lactone lactonase YvrE